METQNKQSQELQTLKQLQEKRQTLEKQMSVARPERQHDAEVSDSIHSKPG